MNRANPILFIHGGGDDGYEAGKALVRSLQQKLGAGYEINYSELQSDESLSDFGWIRQIEQKILKAKDHPIVVAHSLGASMFLKYLSEKFVGKTLKGVFLISTPFWSGNEAWKTGLKLQKNFADNIPDNLPIFFYHCKDDEVVPFSQFEVYKHEVSRAIFREFKNGGHLLANHLTAVARDIEALR